MEVVAKVGFRMFWGMTCEVANVHPDGRSFSLFLYENPLSIFVELPKGSGTGGGGRESIPNSGNDAKGGGRRNSGLESNEIQQYLLGYHTMGIGSSELESKM